MCGIAGIYYTDESKGKEEWTVNETAQLLFPALRHRGPHAFGWMTSDGETIAHETFTGDVGLLPNLAQVKLPESAKWAVLHVRWATHGDTEIQHNNHPIEHGDIIGVHNGVLQNHEAVLAECGGRQYEDSSVDSEAIFAAVDTFGHRAGLRKIRGDMAVVYARRSKPNYLYFAKSYGRPMIFARTKAGSLVWASELKILREVFGRDNLIDVRELNERQLVRVDDARVQESCQFAPDPPPKVVTRRKAITAHKSSGGFAPRSGNTKGVQEMFARRKAAASPPPAPARLTKKQKRRARRSELAREEAAAALRDASPGGLYYYGGILVTADELELLEEYHDELVEDEECEHCGATDQVVYREDDTLLCGPCWDEITTPDDPADEVGSSYDDSLLA